MSPFGSGSLIAAMLGIASASRATSAGLKVKLVVDGLL